MIRLPRALRTAALSLSLALAAAAPVLASALDPAPVPAASFDAGSLHVDTYGHGPVNLILIPGLASGPWSWYGTIDRFTAGDLAGKYTIYALTLPGFDGRLATNRTPLFDAFASDVWALLDAKKIAKPVLIGHSLGGTLAIALAEQHPERLAGIVAVDGLPVFPMLANATPEQRQAAGARMAATYAALDPAQELAGEKAYMGAVGTNQPGLVDSTAALEAKSDPKAIAAWAKEDLETDLRPGLSKIAIPFVEIMPYNPADAKPPANYTQAQTQAFYESLIAGAPQGKVVAIAPARHFAMLDQPEAFYAALTQFLASLP
jgi:pimeloyl-ACP methyl ester carboxylesterase